MYNNYILSHTSQKKLSFDLKPFKMYSRLFKKWVYKHNIISINMEPNDFIYH